MGYNGSLQNKKVLITCGPTWVRIDPVRVFSNISSGELAHTIAENLLAQKAKVTLLEGPATHQLRCPSIKKIDFKYFEDFAHLFRAELKKTAYNIVIHAAAVSDYTLGSASKKKISSHLDRLQLCLTPTQKLIEEIKEIAPAVFLVGFKLETDLCKKNLQEKVRRLIHKTRCDLVVANTVHEGGYRAHLFDRQGRVLAKARSRKIIARELIKAIKEQL